MVEVQHQEGRPQDCPVTSEEGRSPLAEPEEASVCLPMSSSEHSPKVTVLSLKKKASHTGSRGQAATHRPSRRAQWHWLSSPTLVSPPINPRTQAAARSRAPD